MKKTFPAHARIPAPLKKAHGFSLVELMVAVVIGLFITLGLSQLFLSMYTSSTTQRQLAAFQDNQRLALTVLLNNLDLAGYFYDPSTTNAAIALPAASLNTDGTTFTGGIGIIGKGAATGTTSDSINIYYQSGGSTNDGIINCQGGQATGATTKTTFINSFSIKNNQLICEVRVNGAVANSTKALVIASNVNTMHILYGVANSILTGTPSIGAYMSGDAVTTAGVWDKVLSVQITLTLANPATGTTSTWVQTANVFH